MTHRAIYIPACETFGISGGPQFSTKTVAMANGRERRNAAWDQPKHRFVVPFKNLNPAAYTSIKQVHLNSQGMLHSFLYLDRLDYQAARNVFAVALPGQQEFQLGKYSELDGVLYQRKVFALYRPDPANPGQALPATPQIFVNNVLTGGWTFDYDRGVAYAPAPLSGGQSLSWSGTFSVWVHFNQDDLPFSIDNKAHDGWAINGQIELIEDAAPLSAEAST